MGQFQNLRHQMRAMHRPTLEFYLLLGLIAAENWHAEILKRAKSNTRVWVPIWLYAVLWLCGARWRSLAVFTGFSEGLQQILQASNMVIEPTGLGAYVQFTQPEPPPNGGLPLPSTESPATGGVTPFHALPTQ